MTKSRPVSSWRWGVGQVEEWEGVLSVEQKETFWVDRYVYYLGCVIFHNCIRMSKLITFNTLNVKFIIY